MYAIIGGSGLAKLAGLQNTRRQVVRTPYGDPSGPLTFGQLDGVDLVFLARHGYGHTIAPHDINYRANVWALHKAGVDGVVSVATVGGIGEEFGPGALVLPDQIIDYTFGRRNTYFEGADQPVTHIDFTWPYDQSIRERLARAAASIGEPLLLNGTYGCAQGPRLETAAEIRRMARDGCDLVGMTALPEAALARELGLRYGMLAMVVNRAAGLSPEPITLPAIRREAAACMAQVDATLACLAALLASA